MISPHEISSEDRLLSCFGKYEMEVAARKIIELAKEANDWNIPLVSKQFKEEMELEGFELLDEYGWLIKDGESYYVKPDFINRLESHVKKITLKT